MKLKHPETQGKYNEYQVLDLPSIDQEVLEFWEQQDVFRKSISQRTNAEPFVFYEGPPSANGLPGIHHVLSRSLKDIFCRYKTLKGYKVERKGGWDTHGLPVELGVEKTLGITKKDIGTKISVIDYNNACRKEVLKYKDIWNDLTVKMGYWVDLDDPYVTFENEYIESLWALLKRLYDKDLLYKGYTIQPFSPAAGTQLSSHELNLPGCYKDVKDTTVTAQFKIADTDNDFFMAWTTTPWTLPSNTALAVGKNIDYVKIATYNQYTKEPINVIMAEALLHKYFKPENETDDISIFDSSQKEIPYKIIDRKKGSDFDGVRYEQLLPYVQPDDGDAFRVIMGDFVTTEDGTGIVHIAPSFGADDMRVAAQNGIGSLTLVNRQGRFVKEVTDFADVPVKDYDDDPNYESVDIQIAVKLKKENRAFKVEKYEHSYPHCWRTDKPVIYYPLDSWFIKTTKVKERMVELNKTINWKPKSTGEGRFHQWLENLIDWNLSRSRFWGTPLPIWRTEDKEEEKCIGSIADLRAEVQKAVEAGFMDAQLADDFDLHKPYVDEIFLVSDSGKKMTREADLIDVWFDSGAMPYAQWHYPLENDAKFTANFPADFIAEGVDQTRGWFYTLHALAVMLEDSVAYKNVVSNGLVQDKYGNKMSKSKGNAVEPFALLSKFGADATRWYMISNASPWDNLKFDEDGIDEVRRKLFGTLYNTYSFFSLYANIDGFKYSEENVPASDRSEIDRWINSLLNTLIKEVESYYEDYEPTKAARAIQDFVDRHLSNWYVRLSRRVFWKGEYTKEKIAAYQTLYRCMEVIMKLMSPIAPFFTEFIWQNLNKVSGRDTQISIHLSAFPVVDEASIDSELEKRMRMAQDVSSLALSLRKKEKIKVRQPLSKLMIPVLDRTMQERLEKVEQYVLSEVNIKTIDYVTDSSGMFTKRIKPNFKVLGPKYGPKMKQLAQQISTLSQEDIGVFEKDGRFMVALNGDSAEVLLEEVEIATDDIPGWQVASLGDITVALDISMNDDLVNEGIAREFVNRVQNMRKTQNLDVTDRIQVNVSKNEVVEKAFADYKTYICTEILAQNIEFDVATAGEKIELNDQTVQVVINPVKS